MISLNDYLYSGDTVLKILHNYAEDLKTSAIEKNNVIDLAHHQFVRQQIDFLEHNEFLTSQSNRIKEFYKYMAQNYPFLAFTFKGRIKSVIRAEAKYNGYIVEKVSDYYKANGTFPEASELVRELNFFRDLIAYRIVISLPSCHVRNAKYRHMEELHYLYEIASALPDFLGERGFSAQISSISGQKVSTNMKKEVLPYFRDYVQNPSANGYQSLHATFFDNMSRNYVEVQLRTKDMDDHAEIGAANHFGYEQEQEHERAQRDWIPKGECVYFDDAYERGLLLQKLDLSKIDVNMFAAVNNTLVNDCCGLYRGRLILPFEHLSSMQNDIVD